MRSWAVVFFRKRNHLIHPAIWRTIRVPCKVGVLKWVVPTEIELCDRIGGDRSNKMLLADAVMQLFRFDQGADRIWHCIFLVVLLDRIVADRIWHCIFLVV